MDQISILGGKALEGTIKISGSKNAALPVLVASLLTNEISEIRNVPDLVDIFTMKELLISLGIKVKKHKSCGYVVRKHRAKSNGLCWKNV